MSKLRRHLTYANVMSTLAVFLVLGGATAFAVNRALPKRSVGAKQLKPGAVKAKKLAKGAVTTRKLRKGAVNTRKLRMGAVRTLQIADDAVTGDKVNEASLGQVPSAAAATTATTAEGPVVFAHVSGSGELLDGRGVLVTVGNGSDEGVPYYYCFSGLPFAPRGMVASADYRNATPNFNTVLQVGLTASGGLGGTGCPEGTQAYVHGTQADTNNESPVGFYAVFFR